MWTVSEQARDAYGLYWIRHTKTHGFQVEQGAINGGGNSGYQAIHLAATFGAKRIVLLGFDMQRTDGKEHWHGKHEGTLPSGRGFAKWIRDMEPLAQDLRVMDVDVVNCTPTTALRCFDRRPLSEVLECDPTSGETESAEGEVTS
jgi:hypothetical protein